MLKKTTKNKENHRPRSVIFSRKNTGIGGGAVEKLNVFCLKRWKIPLETFKNKTEEINLYQ
jgi:hypothetical protein